MSKKQRTQINLGLIIGTLGFIAGIGLLFTESWLIGIFGSIASAGIAYKGYQDSRESKN
jgi:ABC-type transport system involved in cytochrome bd biosynthesis fused ATPase/permease subunit